MKKLESMVMRSDVVTSDILSDSENWPQGWEQHCDGICYMFTTRNLSNIINNLYKSF